MNTVITINGNTNSMENFVTWVPSTAQVRLENPGEAADPVRVRLQNQTPGGRQLRFGAARSGPGQDTLELDLPVSGDPVPFFVAGKFDPAETKAYDATLEVVEAATGNPLSVTPVFVRVRRNADTIDETDAAYRDIVLSAFLKINRSFVYQTFRDMHVGPSDDEAHGFPGFLPWHRSYLLDLEREMQKEEPRFALPYWRFDMPSPNVFLPDFMGGADPNDGSLVLSASNPLFNWNIDQGQGFNRAVLFDVATSAANGLMGPVISESRTMDLGLPNHTYRNFRRMEGNPHGAAHMSFVGELDNTTTAAKDPLFFMLHCNVDRLWAVWQARNNRFDGSSTSTYSTGGWPFPRVGHRLNDTMWPWNLSITAPRPDIDPPPGGDFPPSTIVAAPGLTPRIADMIDFQGVLNPANGLGFDYDVVPFAW